MVNFMDWTQSLTIIGSLLVPTLAGFAWMIHRMDRMEERLNNKIEGIDRRLTRLEGCFEERGRWESRKS